MQWFGWGNLVWQMKDTLWWLWFKIKRCPAMSSAQNWQKPYRTRVHPSTVWSLSLSKNCGQISQWNAMQVSCKPSERISSYGAGDLVRINCILSTYKTQANTYLCCNTNQTANWPQIYSAAEPWSQMYTCVFKKCFQSKGHFMLNSKTRNRLLSLT